MTSRRYAQSFPILNGTVITQSHADYCRDNGHATYSVDDMPGAFCIRCGDYLGCTCPVWVDTDDFDGIDDYNAACDNCPKHGTRVAS